jgi:hypothetical protein
MGEMGVPMETVQWERGVLPWRQYCGGEGCNHGDGTMGKRGVTMETAQWWIWVMETAQWERGVTMQTVTMEESGATMETFIMSKFHFCFV